jgi:hypothetical protein
MLLHDLADACRKSGLPVEEVDGWQTRGHGALFAVNGIVCHHTATPLSATGDYPSLRIVRDGRSDLPGPLSQLGLGRDGTVYVIAAGVAYHAGKTFYPRQDNWHTIGIEAEHDGISEWPPVLHSAYVRLVAALVEHYGVPLSNVQGHKEVAYPLGRKIDPNFDMTDFRARVKRVNASDVRADLNAAMASTKDALAKVARRPRLRFQLERARAALSKARRINRGQP